MLPNNQLFSRKRPYIWPSPLRGAQPGQTPADTSQLSSSSPSTCRRQAGQAHCTLGALHLSSTAPADALETLDGCAKGCAAARQLDGGCLCHRIHSPRIATRKLKSTTKKGYSRRSWPPCCMAAGCSPANKSTQHTT